MEQLGITAPRLTLLLLAQDEVWRRAVLPHASAEAVESARSVDDAVQHIERDGPSFTYVLVEPAIAGPQLTAITDALTRQPDSTLVLLGTETAFSAATPALRAAAPADLQVLIKADPTLRRTATLSSADIVTALDAGQIACQFQPIVRLTDGKPVGIEALARLQHPVRGTVMPDRFIPQIETAGLSMRLTQIVVAAAMDGIDSAFLTQNAMFLTINLPLDILLLDDALALLEAYRQRCGMGVENILIELTESQPVTDIAELSAAVDKWRDAGYQLAIDDLGPDMVNQIDLIDLPFQIIKLDKSIVLRARDNPAAQSYIQRTIGRAKSRSIRVIAEGVEDLPLWTRMRDMGVDYAQGFLIAHAMPADALVEWMRRWDARRPEAAQLS